MLAGGRCRGAPVSIRAATERQRRVVAFLILALTASGSLLIDAAFHGGLSGVAALIAAVLAPGLAILLWVRVSPLAIAAVAPASGIAITASLSTLGIWAGLWSPRLLTVVVFVMSSISALVWLIAHRSSIPDDKAPRCNQSRLRSAGRPRMLRASSLLGKARSAALPDCFRVALIILLFGAALALWLSVLGRLPNAEVTDYGLAASGSGLALLVCAVLLTAGFVLAFANRHLLLALASLGLLVCTNRITVPLITEVPIYEWTYKHIGVVEVIEESGALPLPGTDVFRDWPGMFVLAAHLSELVGIPPVHLAAATTPLLHTFTITLVIALARNLGFSYRAALLAAFITEATNWVGALYFAPQGASFVLGVAFIIMLTAPRSLGCSISALVLFVSIIPMHQLTPVWLILLTAGLVLLRKASWWVLPPMIVLNGLYIAARIDSVRHHGLVSSLNPFDNMQTATPDSASTEAEFTSAVAYVLALILVLLAAIVAIRYRRSPKVRCVAVIAFVPFLLIVVQNYGGEIIYRVYLYALPGV